MYLFIFDHRIELVAASLILSFLFVCVVGRGGGVLQGLFYNLFPLLSASFYLVALVFSDYSVGLDLFAGFLFEFFILYCLFYFYKKLIIFLRDVSCADAVWALKLLLAVQVCLFLPNLLTSGFGILSGDSRLDYLSVNTLAKYLTYGGFLVMSLYASFLSVLVSKLGNLGVFGWFIIVLNVVFSILSGSTGGVFVWILMIAALIDYKAARIPLNRIVAAIVVFGLFVLFSSFIISDFLKLELDVFFNLAVDRFLLVNDARALAIDLRSDHSAMLSFFSESFRSLGFLLGMPASNPPLGVVLYTDGLAIDNGNGANASYMALASYYFPAGYALFPVFLGLFFLLALYVYFSHFLVKARSAAQRVFVVSLALPVFAMFSQDFLGFQLLFPLVIFLFFVYSNFYSK